MKKDTTVGDTTEPDYSAAYLPDSVRCCQPTESTLTEADWEEAYRALWALARQAASAPDFPFVEPDDFESIIADAP